MAAEVDARVGTGPGDGDGRAAFDAFCVREWPPLVAMLAVVAQDRPTAEELAQESLARAWVRWERVGVLERPDLWVRRVGLNLATSWWRRQLVARRASAHAGMAAIAPGPEPDDDALLAAVGRLPARQRTAIGLRYLGDLSVAETARVMGCKEGTVKALTAQGLDRLRRSGLIGAETNDD